MEGIQIFAMSGGRQALQPAEPPLQDRAASADTRATATTGSAASPRVALVTGACALGRGDVVGLLGMAQPLAFGVAEALVAFPLLKEIDK